MIFVLNGMSLKNKGAELMLYAILQEIECKFPGSRVYLPVEMKNVKMALNLENLDIRLKPFHRFIRFIRKYHLNGILRKLHLPEILDDIYAVKKADYFIDAGGLVFSDQQKALSRQTYKWEHLLKNQKKFGTKIIFLPQAFGPIEKDFTKKAIASIGKYSDLIFAREKVSYGYLKESSLVDMSKVVLSPDFTSSVKGSFPKCYSHLKNYVCVIPNARMIDKGVVSKEGYIHFISDLVKECEKCNRKVYILNHEGIGDEHLALECQNEIGDIEVVSRLNAFETKGLIGSAFAVVSSRYHGVASALNSGVPCLATSWNHKYAELFSDYDLNDCVLDMAQTERSFSKMRQLLNEENNKQIREHLLQAENRIVSANRMMWNKIWGSP